MKLPSHTLLMSTALVGLPPVLTSAILHSTTENAVDTIDTGILGRSLDPNDLFGENQPGYPVVCSTLRDCTGRNAELENCVHEMHDFCTSNCYIPQGGHIAFYYEKLACPVASCVAGGGTYYKCYCDNLVIRRIVMLQLNVRVPCQVCLFSLHHLVTALLLH